MNERIKELAKESGLIQYDTDGKIQDVEKFAELIVQECIEQFAFSVTDNTEIIQDRFTQCRKVAKHFGVEE
jgi:hypothetical protein